MDVVSFGLGELDLTMDYFNRMTWKEFRLRHYAWRRQQKRLDYRQRDIMYQILVSNWMDKKKPPSINTFWPLDKQDKTQLESGLEALRKAQEEYKRK